MFQVYLYSCSVYLQQSYYTIIDHYSFRKENLLRACHAHFSAPILWDSQQRLIESSIKPGVEIKRKGGKGQSNLKLPAGKVTAESAH